MYICIDCSGVQRGEPILMERGQTKPQADTKPQNTKKAASRVDKVREEARTKRMLRS